MIAHRNGTLGSCTRTEAYGSALHRAVEQQVAQVIVRIGKTFEVVDAPRFATASAYAFARTFRSQVDNVAYPDGRFARPAVA